MLQLGAAGLSLEQRPRTCFKRLPGFWWRASLLCLLRRAFQHPSTSTICPYLPRLHSPAGRRPDEDGA